MEIAKLNLWLNKDQSEKQLLIYAFGYNILRLSHGFAGVYNRQ